MTSGGDGMSIADRIPTLDKESLINLRANAERLQGEGGAREEQAGLLIPLIDAELAARSPPKPVKPVKRATKAAAKPKAAAKSKAAPKPKAKAD